MSAKLRISGYGGLQARCCQNALVTSCAVKMDTVSQGVPGVTAPQTALTGLMNLDVLPMVFFSIFKLNFVGGLLICHQLGISIVKLF